MVETAQKTIKRIQAQRFSQLDHVSRNFRAIVSDDDTIEDMLDPTYWVAIAGTLVNIPYPKIDVINDSGTYYAEFLVVAATKGSVKVRLLRHETFADVKPLEDDKFEVAFKGPQRKWCVVRKSNHFYEQEKLETKGDAHEWLEANLANLK